MIGKLIFVTMSAAMSFAQGVGGGGGGGRTLPVMEIPSSTERRDLRCEHEGALVRLNISVPGGEDFSELRRCTNGRLRLTEAAIEGCVEGSEILMRVSEHEKRDTVVSVLYRCVRGRYWPVGQIDSP